MKRREFITFLGGMAIAAPRQGAAQTTKVYRLGTLTLLPPMVPTAGPGALLIAGLAEHGYALGQNLAYEARGAAGKVDSIARSQIRTAASSLPRSRAGYKGAPTARPKVPMRRRGADCPVVVRTGFADPQRMKRY
jgi:putative ABC transport system substrate-binding protein